MKNIFVLLVGTILVLGGQSVYAQTSRDSESQRLTKTTSSTSSKKKKGKKAYEIQYDQSIKDYEALMIANKKKYSKMQKGMEKPQYSDPSYFGHKKPPKKRKKGKRKFCKECGIIH
jgi:hypothetical protein